MRLNAFLSLILLFLVGWMQFYSAARQVFNGTEDLKSEVSRLKRHGENERLRIALEHEQFLEFRQNVATLMPDVLKAKGLGEAGYPYRSLASTVAHGEVEGIRQTIAKTLFEKGKEYFKQKNYPKAERAFQTVIDRYGFTPFVPESFFLLAESQYQENNLEQCTAVIEQMVELFPHHELTGFAMIRLGKVYEAQNRNEEAIDIYKTVMRSYPQRDVASQAKASLRQADR